MKQEIIEIIQMINPYVEVCETSRLLEDDVLDSLGILSLISELEGTYGIKIPLDTIRIEDFESVSRIIKLVEDLR